jgi:D-arabinose 5-phosphate isomerase GutQ
VREKRTDGRDGKLAIRDLLIYTSGSGESASVL